MNLKMACIEWVRAQQSRVCWCDLRAQVSSSSSWPSPPDLTPAPPLLTLPYTQHHILTAVSWQYSPVSNHQSDKYGELLKILPYLSFFIHSTYGLSSPNCSNLKCLFDFLQNTCKNLPSCHGYCRSPGLIVQVNNWRFVSQHMMARSHNTARLLILFNSFCCAVGSLWVGIIRNLTDATPTTLQQFFSSPCKHQTKNFTYFDMFRCSGGVVLSWFLCVCGSLVWGYSKIWNTEKLDTNISGNHFVNILLVRNEIFEWRLILDSNPLTYFRLVILDNDSIDILYWIDPKKWCC